MSILRPSARCRVLAVGFRQADLADLEHILGANPSDVEEASTLAVACTVIDSKFVDVVLTESSLPDGASWREVLRELDHRGGLQPLLIASRLADESLWAEVLNLGGFDVLALPFDILEVCRAVSSAQRERLRRARNRAAAQPEPQPVRPHQLWISRKAAG